MNFSTTEPITHDAWAVVRNAAKRPRGHFLNLIKLDFARKKPQIYLMMI
jgi:hypothetical protein